MSCNSLLVDTIGFENHNISFNDSNLLDVSSIQVNRIDATDIYVDGSLTVINTVDLKVKDLQSNYIVSTGNIDTRNTFNILDDNGKSIFSQYSDDKVKIKFDYRYSINDSYEAQNILELDQNGVDFNVSINAPSFTGGIFMNDLSSESYYTTNSFHIMFSDASNSDVSGNYNVQKHPLLSYNPSSEVLHSSYFEGDLSGQIKVNKDGVNNNNTNFKILFCNDDDNNDTSNYFSILNDTRLRYNPSTETLTSGSFNAKSDYRTKTNIEELDENITVSNLRPLVYLKNGKKEIGLLAHELQEVYPFMVCGEKDGKEMQSVNYNGLIGVLINDVKRLSNENQILKLNNDTLKSDYNTLKSRLDSLEEKFNKKFE